MDVNEPNFQSLYEDYSFLIGILLFLLVVDVVLKLITLWQSARRKQVAWFIFLGLINSLGILPVIYLIINRNKDRFKR
ncbi:hypothetical protein G3567_03720 [Psychroflexus sp. YR1-1]|uniref:DUF5652 domain-containing protein n=1 Tax=Psychroflexus aurantiacus TaxID=2709310 RepID=A0A6B3R2G0_9FLAO|nr:DUF5652 family protein [Psychroflexus aurantiacus]NEV93257.1 hypothetical protein [Psychroflexus aurantiacus]